jgi:uncharacterized protein (DUF488 family)
VDGKRAVTVWAVGHSTHSVDGLVALLASHGITQLADIRAVPRSRSHPQFNADALARTLPKRAVRYLHLPRLGGWRRSTPDSPNGAWRNLSFRGYADYALGGEFSEGLTQLRRLAAGRPTAMMCSEALWWRCHRRLVADRLVAAGDTVWHVSSSGNATAHALTDFAVVGRDGRVTYPAS